MIILREDQQALKQNVLNDWNRGVKNTLAVLSTGGGKSVIVSDIVLDGFRSGHKQAVIAHRNELVSQMSGHIARRGIPHNIIAANDTIKQIQHQHRKIFERSFYNPTASTAVVGVDTLCSRKETLKRWAEQIDTWFIDEAHHVLKKNKWGTAVDLFSNARGLGVTATPERADGCGLGLHADGVFENINCGLSMRNLIRIGALSDFEIVCPKSDLEVENLQVSASGDWSVTRLKKAAKHSHIVGDVVENWFKYAASEQTIVFATDIETSNDIAAKFKAFGVKAASLSSKTGDTVRAKYIEDFRNGDLTVLVNVDLFDEGFDVPACNVVIMARPTASLVKYRQMVGRCLRTALGKIYGLIIDLVSNVVRHGLPDADRAWTLDRRDKRGRNSLDVDPDDIPLRVCSNEKCSKPFERYRIACPYCGQKIPPPQGKDRSIDVVDGDLVLLDRATLEKMRKETQPETPANLASRVSHAAGKIAAMAATKIQIEKIETHENLKETIAQWAGIERAKGLSDREITKKFYLLMKCDILTVLNAKQTTSVLNSHVQKIKGWCQ